MPTADGPCRFGQYAPYLRYILDINGYSQVSILSPTSRNAYGDLGALAKPFQRTAWRALVSADLLQKLLLMRRPYEPARGDADVIHTKCLDDLCATLETTPHQPRTQLAALRGAMERGRDRFRRLGPIPAAYSAAARPLIGVVGEIFCRLNAFSNENLVHTLEEQGAETWLSDIVEWIWYTNSERFRALKLQRRLRTAEALGVWLRQRVQRSDERTPLISTRRSIGSAR